MHRALASSRAGAIALRSSSITGVSCPRAAGRGAYDCARLHPAASAIRRRRVCAASSADGASAAAADPSSSAAAAAEAAAAAAASAPAAPTSPSASASATSAAAAQQQQQQPSPSAASAPPPLAVPLVPPQAKAAAKARAALGRAYESLTRARWYGWYLDKLERRPTLTKAATAFCGFVVGDLVAQALSSSPGGGGGHAGVAGIGVALAASASSSPSSPLAALLHGLPLIAIDWARTARMGAFGLLVDGPLGGAYYAWLDRTVWPDDPLSARTVLAKTLLDQTVYSLLGTVFFFAFTKLLETGGDMSAVAPTLAAKFWPTLCANWMVWPLAHVINFRFVPPPLRVLYNQLVSIGWISWLSWLAHNKSAAAPVVVAALAHKAAAASSASSGGAGGWMASLLSALPHL